MKKKENKKSLTPALSKGEGAGIGKDENLFPETKTGSQHPFLPLKEGESGFSREGVKESLSPELTKEEGAESNKAEGFSTMEEGLSNKAKGFSTIEESKSNKAAGFSTMEEGPCNKASGLSTMAEGEEQRAGSKGQGAKGKEQGSGSEHEFLSLNEGECGFSRKESLTPALSKGEGAGIGKDENLLPEIKTGSQHPFLPIEKGESGFSREGVKQVTREISTVYNIKKPSCNGIYIPAESCISGSQAVRFCLMIRVFNN